MNTPTDDRENQRSSLSNTQDALDQNNVGYNSKRAHYRLYF